MSSCFSTPAHHHAQVLPLQSLLRPQVDLMASTMASQFWLASCVLEFAGGGQRRPPVVALYSVQLLFLAEYRRREPCREKGKGMMFAQAEHFTISFMMPPSRRKLRRTSHRGELPWRPLRSPWSGIAVNVPSARACSSKPSRSGFSPMRINVSRIKILKAGSNSQRDWLKAPCHFLLTIHTILENL